MGSTTASTSGRLPLPAPADSPIRLHTQWQGLDPGAALPLFVAKLCSSRDACSKLLQRKVRCDDRSQHVAFRELNLSMQQQKPAGGPLAMKMLQLALKICSGEKCLQQMTPHSDPPSANLLLEQSQTSQMCVPSTLMMTIYVGSDYYWPCLHSHAGCKCCRDGASMAE